MRDNYLVRWMLDKLPVFNKGNAQKAAWLLTLCIARQVCFALLLTTAAHARTLRGDASIYGNGDGYAWGATASGERMNPNAMTCAILAKTGPLQSKWLVTNLANGRSIICRVNDRGPFIRGRIIDLTPAGARALRFSGLTNVQIERIE